MKYTSSNKRESLPILYEDNDIIVIDKPCGMLSIATDKESARTAYRLVNDYVRGKRKQSRIFIVHRLDRETSGVMLFAKNERAKHTLQQNWADMAIAREYVAVVQGRVTADGTVTSWLKQNGAMVMYSSNRDGDGKRAVTHYRVLSAKPCYSTLALTLETGRKNQIRVHMKDIGHPVVGDKKYGNGGKNPLGRLGLHALSLTVRHPTNGDTLRFEAAIPRVFMAI